MAATAGLLVSILLFCWAQQTLAIPRSQFYPFGEVAGDSSLPPNDDGSSPAITLQGFFPYFGEDHTTLFVNNNGDVSFDGPVSSFTPQSFPLESGMSLIAPYWADIDTRGTGNIYYRETADVELLRRARDDIIMAFSGTVRFQPSFLFVATWDRVGHYNRNTERIATFQCVLMTDGTFSFAMFLYADGEIQWTTGDASGGTEGFGGTPAQVGFDAGDGVRFFSVPGSQTDAIVNIPNTSNVGRPGVWIFQVNGDITSALDCINGIEAPLAIMPRLGSMLGGTAILLRGPCFEPEMHTVRCNFDAGSIDPISVQGMFVDNSDGMMAVCVSPAFDESGWKSVDVTIWMGDEMVYENATRFYAVHFQDAREPRHNRLQNLLLTPDTDLTITWDPNSFLFVEDPESFFVDIILTIYDLEEGEWVDVATLIEGITNDGSRLVRIPPVIVGNNPLFELRPVAIQITVGRQFEDSRRRRQTDDLPMMEQLRGQVKQWTAILYYSLSDSLRQQCEDWCDEQPSNIGEVIINELTPCPPLLRQARTPNSGLVEDMGISRVLSNSFFHPGTETCFRSRQASESGYGQQCCYNNTGFLVVGSPGGTVDRFAPIGAANTVRHFIDDVIPAIYCCSGDNNLCGLYNTKRPSDNGTRYNPPPPACVYGDPHIVTLDGFKYTFNGLGEFILAEVDDSFSLQGRMVQVLDPNGVLVNATVFSAIVIREGDSDVIQFQSGALPDDPEAIVNGEFVNFIDLPVQDLDGVSIVKSGNTLSARFDSGVYVEVREENGFLSTLLVSLPAMWRGQTRGLMGNYNDDTSDDLSPREGSPLSLDSDLREIHEQFGISWIIDDEEDSLFTYSQNEDFFTYYRMDFEPAYEVTFSNETLEELADEICGDDQFCRFDIATTENTMIGLSTLIGNQEFEEIVNISQPIVCTPPCANGVCIAANNCSCSVGYVGERCEILLITECDDNPCENNGSCEVRAGSYICTCMPDFTGISCQTEIVTPTDPPTTAVPTTPSPTTEAPIVLPPPAVDVLGSDSVLVLFPALPEEISEIVTIYNIQLDGELVITAPRFDDSIVLSDLTPETVYVVAVEVCTPFECIESPPTTFRTQEAVINPGSGSGSGSGVVLPTDCICTRDIECSVQGMFTGQTNAATSGDELKCTFSFGEDFVDSGSTSSFVVDGSFSADFLSAGSLNFLTTLGVLSRDQGFSSCNVEGLSTQRSDDDSEEEEGRIETLILTYLHSNGSFLVRPVEMDDIQEIFLEMDFSLGNDLDEVNQCSFITLVQWLFNQPPYLPEAVCRNPSTRSGAKTSISFPVSCPPRFGF